MTKRLQNFVRVVGCFHSFLSLSVFLLFLPSCISWRASFSSSVGVQLQHFKGPDTFSACWVILVFYNPAKHWHGLQDLQHVYVVLLQAYARGGTAVSSLIRRTFLESAQIFDSWEISQRAQTLELACNSHPSMWWCDHARLCFTFGFQVWVVSLPATDAPLCAMLYFVFCFAVTNLEDNC